MMFPLIAQIVSWLALAGVIGPPVLFLRGDCELDEVKSVMLVATLAWFLSSVLWMGRKPSLAEESTEPLQ